MAQAPERTVVINGSGGGGGGIGMGVMLGAILVVVLGIGVLWFVMSGRMASSATNPPPVTIPTTNITTPDIKIPDNITINTPNITTNPPAPVQEPTKP